MCLDAADEVVCLVGHLLLLHLIRQHKVQRGPQADHEQLYAFHLLGGNVLPAKPHTHDHVTPELIKILKRTLHTMILSENINFRHERTC